MPPITAAFAIALGCLGFASADALSRTVERADDRGITVRLAAPAARIVTLAPHLAEIVHAAGAGDKLIGAVHFSDYPEAAREVARVGDASRVDIERILALQPDLILAWTSGNQPGDVRRLERLGLAVFATEPLRLADVSRLIRAVGALAGTDAVAERAAAKFERSIAALRERYANRRAIRVFYEIWHRPLITINGKHMISDVLDLCGGTNVFAAVPALTPTVSLEAVAGALPEAIVGGGSAVREPDFVRQWRSYRIQSLQAAYLIHVAPDTIQRASPRLAEGARALCEALERLRSTPR